MQDPLNSSARNPALDVLRAVAILLVLGNHLPVIPIGEQRWLLPVAAWKRVGWIGVDLFFVLSGFLIAGLLFQEFKRYGSVSLQRFYVRRGFKIYPPFYVFLVVSVLVAAFGDAPVPWGSVIAEAAFVQSYHPGMWSHTWSLAVEEHFYILLPLLIVFLIKREPGKDPFRKLIAGFIVLGVVLLAARIINAQLRPYRHLYHTFPTHLRIDSLMMGVVLSYLYHFHRENFVRFALPHRRKLLAVGVLMLLPAIAVSREGTPFMYTFGFTLCYLGSAAILTGLLMCRLPQSRPVKWLAYMGSHSYSIYLWHLMVLLAVERMTAGSWGFVAQSSVYLVASIIVGIAMAKIIEVPVLAFRDRWFPSRPSAPVVAKVDPEPEPAAQVLAVGAERSTI